MDRYDFGRKIDGLKALKQELAELRTELSELKVPYRELEWLSDTGQMFQPRRMNDRLWETFSAEAITEVSSKRRDNH